jgi:hypothetical protein
MELSAHIRSKRLACAYYEPIRAVIYVLEDTTESRHHDLTHLGENTANLALSDADDCGSPRASSTRCHSH